MLTEENPPVIESALLILGKTIERKQVIVQKIEVTIMFLFKDYNIENLHLIWYLCVACDHVIKSVLEGEIIGRAAN